MRMVDRAAMLWRAFSAGLLMLAAVGSIAHAELVILTSGRIIKAKSHQAAGEMVEIRLPDGNSYTVDRKLVERIVDDEVATDAQGPQQPSRHVEAQPAAKKEPAASSVTVTALEEPADPAADDKHLKQPRRRHGRHRR